MALLRVDTSFASHREVLVLLVPANDDITALEFTSLCERVESTNMVVSALSGDGRSPPRERDVLTAWHRPGDSRQDQVNTVGFKHMSWKESSIRCRTKRCYTRKPASPRVPYQTYQRVWGVIGLRARGRISVEDERRTLEIATARAQNPSCALRIFSPDESNLRTLVDALLVEICHVVHAEAIATVVGMLPTGTRLNSCKKVSVSSGGTQVSRSSSHSDFAVATDSGASAFVSFGDFERQVSTTISYNESPGGSRLPPLSRAFESVAARHVPLLRRGSSTLVKKSERARRLKVFADLALLVSALKDAAELASSAARELRALGDTPWLASALLTWIAALLCADDSATLVHILECAPLSPSVLDPALGLTMHSEAGVKVGMSVDAGSTESFTPRVGVSGSRYWDKAAYSQLPEAELRQLARCYVAVVSNASLHLLRKNGHLARVAAELALKIARWSLFSRNKRSLVIALETALSIVERGTLGAVETARAVQAAAVMCERAALPRKSSLYATIGSQACIELCNWTSASLLARFAEYALHNEQKPGWALITALAGYQCMKTSHLHGDVYAAARSALVVVHYLEHCVQLVAQHQGWLGATSHTWRHLRPGMSSCGLQSNLRASALLFGREDTTLDEVELSMLENAEAHCARLPDDVLREQSYTIMALPSFTGVEPEAAHLNTGGLSLGDHNGSISHGLHPVRDKSPLLLDHPFMYNPYIKCREMKKKMDSDRSGPLWVVGERSVVVVALINPLFVPIHVQTARLVCVGCRCVCHELRQVPSHPTRVESLNDTRTSLELQITPLESGTVTITGVILRASVYVTTNQTMLSQTFHAITGALRTSHCAVELTCSLQFLGRVDVPAFTRRNLRANLTKGFNPGTRGVPVVVPQPEITASLFVMPHGGSSILPCAPSQAQSAHHVECLNRMGERVVLGLIITSHLAIPLIDFEIHARIEGHLCQKIFCANLTPNGCKLQCRLDKYQCIRGLSSLLPLYSVPQDSVITKPHAPIITLLEVKQAAKRFGGGEIVLSYVYGEFSRDIRLHFLLKNSHCLRLHNCTFLVRDEKTCDARMQISNDSNVSVLVGVENQSSIIRAGEQNATFALMFPRRTIAHVDPVAYARWLVSRIEWRVDGSENGCLDGIGSLTLPSCNDALINVEALLVRR